MAEHVSFVFIPVHLQHQRQNCEYHELLAFQALTFWRRLNFTMISTKFIVFFVFYSVAHAFKRNLLFRTMFNRTIPISQWFAMHWDFDSALDGICVVNKFQMSSLPLFTKHAAQTKLAYENVWNHDTYTTQLFKKSRTNDRNLIRIS